MVDRIYIEEAVREHPRVEAILDRFPKAAHIPCERYGEVFNPRSQNFRLQKKNPALILAEKQGQMVLPTPPDYSIGADENYYFSHLLNCPYDCRYCFLQGMYQSANFVLFVNYEDFESALRSAIPQTGRACFFSGYDCDSLAMESITGFAEHFVPFFRNHPEAWFEFRTKSVMTRPLIDREPLPNVIVSYTLSPDKIAREIEHGAPPVAKRIAKIRELTEQGWTVGLRFDPLQPYPGFTELYRELFQQVFTSVASESIHSATLGPMRFPTAMHDKIVKLYPDAPLFARFPTETRNGQVSLPPDLEEHLVAEVTAELEQFMPAEKVFRQTF